MGARIVDALDEEDKGSGSSMISFIMYFSSALGTALVAGLFGFGSGAGSGSIADVGMDVFMDGFVFCAAVFVAISFAALVFSYILRTDRRSE